MKNNYKIEHEIPKEEISTCELANYLINAKNLELEFIFTNENLKVGDKTDLWIKFDGKYIISFDYTHGESNYDKNFKFVHPADMMCKEIFKIIFEFDFQIISFYVSGYPDRPIKLISRIPLILNNI